MPLKQRKQIFQISVTKLKFQLAGARPDWLFTKRDQGFELGPTEKQILPVAGGGLQPGTSGLQHQRP